MGPKPRAKRSKGKQRAIPVPPTPAALIPSAHPSYGAADPPDPEEAAENLLNPVAAATARVERANAEMRFILHVPDSLTADDPDALLPESAPTFRVRIAVRPLS